MPKNKTRQPKSLLSLTNIVEETEHATMTPVDKPSRNSARLSKKREKKILRLSRGGPGECVFHALLTGIMGLMPNGPTSHETLVKKLKDYASVHQDTSCFDNVYFCGKTLTPQEYLDCCASMEHLHVRNGYLCAAMDPLLLFTAAAFRIDIIHDFIGNVLEFLVDKPRRRVMLRSSMCHMSHVANIDLVVPSKSPPACLSNNIGSTTTCNNKIKKKRLKQEVA
jgi:hypothetical protein